MYNDGEVNMGDYTDMVMNGTLCEQCGSLVTNKDPNKISTKELSPGHPRVCSYCKKENDGNKGQAKKR